MITGSICTQGEVDPTLPLMLLSEAISTEHVVIRREGKSSLVFYMERRAQC
jgi:hypothetical protein